MIGRLVEDGVRELVISRRKTGFVALYRFTPRYDLVTILRIRHQRELGYP
jgi:plasmid stabilization system protein ParE